MKRKPRSAPQQVDGDSDRKPAPHPLWFVGRFVAGLAVSQVVVAWLPSIESWAVRSTLDTLRLLAGLFGAPGAVTGDVFRLGTSQVQIVGECTPLMPTLVLAAAMVAYPTAWRDQLLGILGGGLVIWAFNLIRIGALMVVLAWRPASFDFIHMYLWQTLTLLVVFSIFVLWLKLLRPRPEPR